MKVPWVAWVGLIVTILPILGQFITTQWPESNGYAWSTLITLLLAAIGRWLEITFLNPPAPPVPPATPRPRAIGETGASTPPPPMPSKMRRFLVG